MVIQHVTEQRLFTSITWIALPKIELVSDQPIKISLILQNAGHTPANKLIIQMGQAIGDKAEPFPSNPTYFHLIEPPNQNVIAPGDALPVDFGIGPFSVDDIKAVNEKL